MTRPISSDILLVNRDGVDYQASYEDLNPSTCDLPLIPGPPVIALNGAPQTAPAEPGDPIVIIRNGDGPDSPVNQWQRGSRNSWTNIAGATGVDYEVTEEDRTFNIRLEQTFSDGSELYSNEIVGPVDVPLPWENWPGGIFHIKNVQNAALALIGGPFTAYDVDGTNKRQISGVSVGEELVFVTDPDCTGLFKDNGRPTWEFGDFTDVSKVTDMSDIFFYCYEFNADISDWNTSNVTNITNMFRSTNAFDQNIGGWDTSNVTNMMGTFRFAGAFNSDISNWDVGNVTDMRDMFYKAAVFNSDISNWDVGNVTNMGRTFYNTNVFNSDISNWNVSNVTNMSNMFQNAQVFNQDLSGWCVSNISSKPSSFDTDSGFAGQTAKQPQWGTCP